MGPYGGKPRTGCKERQGARDEWLEPFDLSGISFAITHAQQVQHAVQAQRRDRLLGRLAHQRLGAEGYTEAGDSEHRQVVGTVADGNGLLHLQTFLACQLSEQVGFALRIDDRLDRHARALAVDHFQFVGEHVVDTQLGLQLLGEVGEATGEDGGLVTQALEFGEQGLGTFGQAQRRTDLVQHADIQALEQRQALLEAGTKIQLATHGPLGDFRDLLADTGGLGQFVDHFSLDQRRVHIEHRQTAIAAEQRVLLEGDIDVQFLRDAEEFGTQGLRIGRLAAHGKLDAALALLRRGVQRDTAGQAIDVIDIEFVLGGDGTDPLQLLGGDLAGQQGNDVAGLALAIDPVAVVGFGNRSETHLLVQFVAGEKQILEDRRALLGVRNFHQDAEGQGVMDHRLANIENIHAAPGEDASDGCGKTRTVLTGDVDQDDFAQDRLRVVEKMRILPLFADHRAQPILCRVMVARYTAQQFLRHKEPRSVNRPTPVKTDNFFLLIFRALRQRRVPLALRIACHNIFLVALALVIYAGVMGLQFKEAMHEQTDALGQSLTTQTATSATELLVSNDILSLNVLLGNLVKNPLVAHAAIYSVDNRILAEAGQRPKNGLLGEAEGLYQTKITFQEVTAGQLRISLDMSQFQQPMTISMQSMGILAGILLALALTMSLRLGRYVSTPLLQLRVWLRDLDEYTPATERQDEIGDLARQLHARFAPPPREVEPEPEIEEDFADEAEPAFQVRNLRDPAFDEAPAVVRPPARVTDDDEDDEAFADLRDDTAPSVAPAAPAVPRQPQASAVLAVQLGSQEQLRRLPRTRLTELLERYRDCLEQAASLYESEVQHLNDGSTLLLFHSQDSGEDYLTNAICCGELLRALGHALQVEVADSGITLQLQLGLVLGEGVQGLSQIDLLLTEKAQDALALSQHSRNLLLVERKIGDDALIRQRARIRPIASPEGACCVERLMEPYPSMLERQLARMHERQVKN